MGRTKIIPVALSLLFWVSIFAALVASEPVPNDDCSRTLPDSGTEVQFMPTSGDSAESSQVRVVPNLGGYLSDYHKADDFGTTNLDYENEKITSLCTAEWIDVTSTAGIGGLVGECFTDGDFCGQSRMILDGAQRIARVFVRYPTIDDFLGQTVMALQVLSLDSGKVIDEKLLFSAFGWVSHKCSVYLCSDDAPMLPSLGARFESSVLYYYLANRDGNDMQLAKVRASDLETIYLKTYNNTAISALEPQPVSFHVVVHEDLSYIGLQVVQEDATASLANCSFYTINSVTGDLIGNQLHLFNEDCFLTPRLDRTAPGRLYWMQNSIPYKWIIMNISATTGVLSGFFNVTAGTSTHDDGDGGGARSITPHSFEVSNGEIMGCGRTATNLRTVLWFDFADNGTRQWSKGINTSAPMTDPEPTQCSFDYSDGIWIGVRGTVSTVRGWRILHLTGAIASGITQPTPPTQTSFLEPVPDEAVSVPGAAEDFGGSVTDFFEQIGFITPTSKFFAGLVLVIVGFVATAGSTSAVTRSGTASMVSGTIAAFGIMLFLALQGFWDTWSVVVITMIASAVVVILVRRQFAGGNGGAND